MKFIPMTLHYLRYSPKQFLDKLERSPFDTFDLYMSAPQLNPFDYALGDLLQLDKEIRRRGLKVYAITPENCTYPCNFATQNRETRESSLRYYQRAIDTAEYLECPNVQISIGFGYFDAPRQEAWDNTRESLRQLAEYSARKGVTLFLEECKDTTTQVLNTSEDIAQMLRELGMPNVLGMVDTDQMTFAGQSLDDYFRSLGSKLGYVHFNDRGHTVPGHGSFPMKQYYEDLRRLNYQGVCCFELTDRQYYIDPDKAVDQCIDWLVANTEEWKDWRP